RPPSPPPPMPASISAVNGPGPIPASSMTLIPVSGPIREDGSPRRGYRPVVSGVWRATLLRQLVLGSACHAPGPVVERVADQHGGTDFDGGAQHVLEPDHVLLTG